MAKNQKKKDMDACKKIDALFKESEEYRKQFHKEFNEGEQFYAGNHWPSGVKRPFKNHVFRIIESEVPVLTDSRPSTEVVAIDPEKEHVANLLNAAKDHIYREQCLNLKDSMSIKQSLVMGTAFQYVDYDPDLADGEGDVCVKNIPWRQCFPDPTANEIEECRYFGFKFPVDIEDVKRRFPKAKDIQIISPDAFMSEDNSESAYGEDQNFRNFDSDEGSKGRYESDTLTTLEEMWFKDYSTDPISIEETEDEIAKESIEIQQGINPDISKYENHAEHIQGHEEQRMILASEFLQMPVEEITEKDLEALKEDQQIGLIFAILDDHIEMHESYLEAGFDKAEKPRFEDNLHLIIKVGKQVLYDGPSPFNDGMYPVAPFYCYKDEKSFWATGEAKNIIPIQKSVNEMDWAEYAGLRLVGNSGWILDESSGVDESTLTNEPGLVVIKKQGTEVQRLQPGQISNQILNRKASDVASMLEISGVNEATMGEAPTGDPSGVAIKKLQQQAIGRIRQKSRIYEEYTIPRRDKLIISRIMRYYSTERNLRIDDEMGDVSFISFDPEMVKDLKYDLKVSQGTAAGLDKEAVYAIMSQLAQGGVIDPATFIKAVDIPQKGMVLKSIAANDQTAALLQQTQLQNLQLKAQFAPQLLSEEEIALLEQQESQ